MHALILAVFEHSMKLCESLSGAQAISVCFGGSLCLMQPATVEEGWRRKLGLRMTCWGPD